MNHEKLIHLDLFSGIGGASLAAEWVWPEIEHVFCEIDPFCQQVLKKHWPEARIHGDIRTFTNARSVKSGGLSSGGREEVPTPRSVYLLTGGFPCQPFSQAGRRKGTEDDRYLWPEMLRVIREFRPRWVVGENVAGFVTWNNGMVLRQVLSDLEGEGYEVQAFIIPAVAVNAPHRRDRVWIVANLSGQGLEGPAGSGLPRNPRRLTDKAGDAQNPLSKRSGRGVESSGQILGSGRAQAEDARSSWQRNWPEVATELCSLDDGLPVELGGFKLPKSKHRAEQLKGYGNAWVPQVAAEIFKAIKEVDKKF